jgi:hypothetical protein
MLRRVCDHWPRVVLCVSLHYASATGVFPFCFELTALIFTLLLVLDIHSRYDGTTIENCGYHLVLLLHMERYIPC